MTTWKRACSILLCGLFAANGAAANERALRKVFDEGKRAPWYDAETGGIKPVTVLPEKNEADHRKSRFSWTPPTKNSPRWNWGLPAWFRTAMWWTVWIALALVLIGLGYAIALAVMRSRSSLPKAEKMETWDPEKIEQLPFELANAPDDLMAAARASFEMGDLRQAVILLFSQQLICLDQFDLIQLAKGKTNGFYLMELAGVSEIKSQMRVSVRVFEEVYFGGRMPTETQVRQMWEHTDSLPAECRLAAESLVASL